MATPNVGILTQKGLDMFNKVEVGQDTITYTNMVYSSDNLMDKTDEQLEQLIDLNSKDLTLPTQSFINTDGVTEVRSSGNNKGVASGFYVNVYGIYAHGTDGVEFLYGLTVDDKPSYVTPFDGVSPQSLVMSWQAKISKTQNVTLTATTAVYATIDDLANQQDSLIKKVSEEGFIKSNDDINFTGKLQHSGSDIATEVDAKSYADSAYSHASSDLSNYASSNNLKSSVDNLQVTKVDKSELQGLSDNITNTINPKLDSKADKSDLDTTFQNAVNVSKKYTDDSGILVKPYSNYDDAYNAAKSSNVKGLFLYPMINGQMGKAVNSSIIYSYGNEALPDVRVELTNPDTSQFTFTNAYVTINQKTMVATLHGSIVTKTSIGSGRTVASLNIKQFGMNVVAYSYLNSQSISVNTNYNLEQLVIKNNYDNSSGTTYNIEGCIVNLAYDANAKAKISGDYEEAVPPLLSKYGNSSYYNKVVYVDNIDDFSDSPSNSSFEPNNEFTDVDRGKSALVKAFRGISFDYIVIKMIGSGNYYWKDFSNWNTGNNGFLF
ncbi:hypothetical protein [Nicoliella lavandulae]|uniref:Tail fiber protein n=1 Tax=Nicoliella lavandulae TaxID=3082954 RepID=A0ABU8SMB2_9LACO